MLKGFGKANLTKTPLIKLIHQVLRIPNVLDSKGPRLHFQESRISMIQGSHATACQELALKGPNAAIP